MFGYIKLGDLNCDIQEQVLHMNNKKTIKNMLQSMTGDQNNYPRMIVSINTGLAHVNADAVSRKLGGTTLGCQC